MFDPSMRDWLVGIAEELGGIAIKMHESAAEVETKADKDSSPVTEADRQINARGIELIKERFPHDGVMGEEASVEGASGFNWSLDPIDGTRLWLTDGVYVSPSLARLDESGLPTHAVVGVPERGFIFYAERGQGAVLIARGKERQLRVAENTSFKKTAVFAQCRKSSDFDAFELARCLTKDGANNLSWGSIILEAMWVAMGGLALGEPVVAAIFYQDKPFDLAAAKLIVEEAGGRVTDIYGKDQRYDRPINGGLVTNAGVANQLIMLTGELVKPFPKSS